ncbi:MAG: heavy metal translocating P-type ATPase [Anaerolineaceae bacterium]|nr:heavy metal translocating P-type ATPase [Anaerolineaceae bacterium]
MTERTVEIEIPLLLPEIENDGDDCLVRLQDNLRSHRGISHVHLNREVAPIALCVHFNPNLVSLKNVRRLAQKAGSTLSNRYRHERIPIMGMNNADEAPILRRKLEKIPGMLHADVNYAAGLVFVVYDIKTLQPQTIAQVMDGMGIQSPGWPSVQQEHVHTHVYEQGSAPAFLPHWVQERWTLILVGCAGLFLLFAWAGETFFALPSQIALLFLLLSYLSSGYDIAKHAVPGLLKGKFDTDVLMLAASVGAAILGEWTEGAFLLFLFGLGHAGEHYALDRARNAVNDLGKMMPKKALLKRDGQLVEQPVAILQVGDVVLVRPGDRIPVDGRVIAGESAVDQSPITGESVPVLKNSGAGVFAGTINQNASLEVEVTRLSQDNTLARVIQMVAEAQSQQSPTQQFTERFTTWFVPSVLVFVLLVIGFPPLVGWMPLRESFYRGMLLLVASSPCALALGTPASVLAGIAQAARNGVLIKGGVHLENLGALKVVAFDKTGTLTEGKFSLTDVFLYNDVDEDELLRIAGAVEQSSNHPLAMAIVEAAREKGLSLPTTETLKNVNGRGVRSKIDGRPVLIGSLRFFRDTNSVDLPEEIIQNVAVLEREGKTTMIVYYDEEFLGILALADTLRSSAKETMKALKGLGIQKLVMLTGDNEDVARRIGVQIGVTDVRAGLLPEEKLNAIRELQEQYGPIAMIGDGVNDAPALATATVGIAMGGAGTAVALETADVALMGDDLEMLLFAIGLSRTSCAIIRQNLGVSLGVIALLLVTSVFGWLELNWTVVLHEGSSLVVVLNALRLLGYKKA